MSSTDVKKASVAKRRWRISRRKFLVGAGLAGGTLALGVAFGFPYGRLKLAEMVDSGGGGFFSAPDDPWAWFEVRPDGPIRLYVGKVEMGQGVHTALKQIAAEELGIPWNSLEVRQGTTAVGPQDSNGTNDSTSISSSFMPLRQAAATLSEMLRLEAARQLQLPPDMLSIQERGFYAPGTDEFISFVDIVAGKTGEWDVPEEEATLRSATSFKLVGHSAPRVDIPEKVTGQAVYGYDAKLPGMKFGAVLRSPTIEGRIKRASVGQAEGSSGVVTILIEDEFIGVVADSRPEAWAALLKIEVEWEEGKRWQQEDLEALVTVGGSGGVVIQNEGNASKALDEAVTVTAEYRTPLAVQTPLEAQSALADVQSDRVRIWASTQAQTLAKGQVADALGVDEAIVEIIPTYVGGGFGRKLGDVAVEAARLSKASGLPVHLGWNRPEELRHGFFQPLSHHQMRASLGENGRIQAMEHQLASGDILFSYFPKVMAAVFGADIGVTRGARIAYDIPNRRTVAWRRQLPVKTGSWRGLGLLPNTFALESFMDELAHAARLDPLHFRLNNLGKGDRSRRIQAVLEAAAKMANWEASLPEGRALGIACCLDIATAVAAVAEVSVDDVTGKIRVHRMISAMDCGLVINPDGAKAQMEGNAIWGISAALKEEVRIRDGRVALNNFESYPLLTTLEAPQIEAILVDTGQEQPFGVGEPPIAPIAAAIGNAVFSLTGNRLRHIPFSPERVLEASSAV